MGTAEQLAVALAEVRQQLAVVQRVTAEPSEPKAKGATPTGASGRSCSSPSRAAMGGAFKGLAERAYADLSPEVKLASRQLYYLRVKARTHVRSAEKHHGIAAWKRIKTEYQPEAADRPTAMLMRVMPPGWDSRGVTNNC